MPIRRIFLTTQAPIFIVLFLTWTAHWGVLRFFRFKTKAEVHSAINGMVNGDEIEQLGFSETET